MKSVYGVYYNPNCEENYLVFLSESKKKCYDFCKRKSYTPYLDYKINGYSKYDLYVFRILLNKHGKYSVGNHIKLKKDFY